MQRRTSRATLSSRYTMDLKSNPSELLASVYEIEYFKKVGLRSSTAARLVTTLSLLAARSALLAASTALLATRVVPSA